jgi:hypothetical protein
MNRIILDFKSACRFTTVLVLAFSGVALCCAGDAVEEVRTLTDFKDIELEKLAAGNIASLRGRLMEFPRGISAQTCYFVAASPKATADAIRNWDPSPHAPLGVFAHRAVKSPAREGDFDLSALKTDKSPVHWLVGRTLATKADRSELQISRAEAQEIERSCQGQPQNADTAAACWKKILTSRMAAFQQKGIAEAPPYEMGGASMKMAAEVQSLLKESPLAAARFSKLLGEAKLIGKSTETGPVADSQCYWELITVEDHAALGMGAIYLRAVEDRFQVVDCEYYVSNGFCLSLVFYEIWPVKDGSLVWRTDLLSSPSLGGMKGIDRVAYGKIMLLEIKKAIAFFQEDVCKGAKAAP